MRRIGSEGVSNLGQIFSLNSSNFSFLNVFSFSQNGFGKYPIGSLARTIDNNLYGYLGNDFNSYGGIFKFNPEQNQYSKQIDFNGLNGKLPDGGLTQRISIITTTKSGNWNEPTVWDNGVVPSNASYVTINANHIVDIDGVPVAVKYVELKGTVNFVNGGSLNLAE